MVDSWTGQGGYPPSYEMAGRSFRFENYMRVCSMISTFSLGQKLLRECSSLGKWQEGRRELGSI